MINLQPTSVQVIRAAEILMRWTPEERWVDLVARGIVGTPVGQGAEWMRAWRANNIAVLARAVAPGLRLIWC